MSGCEGRELLAQPGVQHGSLTGRRQCAACMLVATVVNQRVIAGPRRCRRLPKSLVDRKGPVLGPQQAARLVVSRHAIIALDHKSVSPLGEGPLLGVARGLD